MPTKTPNRDLITYTLYLLDGAIHRVHTEDIAVKAHNLFPDSFSWTKYPDLPDKETVRMALVAARKAKFGNLVEGRAGRYKGQYSETKRDPQPDGWILTAAGIQWILSNRERFESLEIATSRPKIHRQKALRQLARIKTHQLFANFVENPATFSPDIGGLAELLRCRVDAPQEVWIKRIEGARRRARISNQEDVLHFADACEAAYRAQLQD